MQVNARLPAGYSFRLSFEAKITNTSENCSTKPSFSVSDAPNDNDKVELGFTLSGRRSSKFFRRAVVSNASLSCELCGAPFVNTSLSNVFLFIYINSQKINNQK